MIEECQMLLMELLRENSGLEQLKESPPELDVKFECMLMEHHHIFSLDKNEIGCMDTVKHVIELMDDEPFQQQFWQIAPPLFCKKDRTLQFCIDLLRINFQTKKDSFPLPHMQENMD